MFLLGLDHRFGDCFRSLPNSISGLTSPPGSWLKAPVSFHEDSGEAEADKSYLTVTGSFYPSQSFQSVDDATEKTEEDDFIEKSFALHDEIHTSQLTASSSYPASDDEAESVASSRRNQPSDRLGLTVPHLTDISKLPSAAHILHIIPQTVTVDLIVGVIAIHPIRRVTIRKTNRETDLAEVLFGDETTAGFSVTFWVKPESPRRKPKSAVTASEDTEDAMRREVQTLRVGDIALVRNVALSQFRGKVHGQSLGRRQPKASARWGTSVSLIWRPGVSRDNLEVFSTGLKDTGDTEAGKRSHLLAAKVTRVRDWARHFIAPPDRDWQYKRKRKASTLDDAERFFMKEQLPLDDSLC